MPTDVTAALQALAQLDGVPAAADRAREAATALRWHEGLRRRWREARAETAVRSAVAGAALEGVRVEPAWLREEVAGGTTAGGTEAVAALPADDALVLAAWRAQVHVGELLGDLGGRGPAPAVPAGELLAGLHRDLTAHLVPAGQLPSAAVGRPRAGSQPFEGGPLDAPLSLRGPNVAAAAPVGEELEARLAGLLAVVDASGAPALVRVAVAHGEIATLRPFAAANGLLARAVGRLLSVRSGLEPTGVAVLDAYAAGQAGAYRDALAGYESGTPAGMRQWLEFQAESVVTGARVGAEVATAVLAGRVGTPG